MCDTHMFSFANFQVVVVWINLNTFSKFVITEHLRPATSIALSAGAVEYTDCFSAEGKDPPPLTNVLYDTK